jgi:uncharacterized protein (TIGR03083 family)
MLTYTGVESTGKLAGLQIPKLTHEEAYKMALAELETFLTLLQDLTEAEWSKPTACPLWDVRQMVAHVVGAAEGYLSFKNFKRQMASKDLKRYTSQGLKGIDATNQLQIDDRAKSTPARLIAELREIGPKSINNRYKLPLLLRALRVYIPILGFNRIDYLTDLIYTRDMWMHRLDICRATGREMTLKPEHDGRITALVVRDLAKRKGNKLKEAGVRYELTGPAGGAWNIGATTVPTATLKIDALDFNLLAAGRFSVKDVMDQNLVKISGNFQLGQLALENTRVPY